MLEILGVYIFGFSTWLSTLCIVLIFIKSFICKLKALFYCVFNCKVLMIFTNVENRYIFITSENMLQSLHIETKKSDF
ncbi:hypothetical protein GLYMA_06G164200v4 [Glycine max]|uniref:Uncharacterized protein n=1 Tax=Glycine max TaxID=3847 RepID=K7KVF5_SOYBN|nr:hypothetical protein GYH30_015308 [Glycine max]KRH54090.1 hypothetical protein GLYMA_06G164200v4 [Glycine max]